MAKTAALQRARALLAPAEQFMRARMAPTVAIAAAVWHVVLMAFMACLMQWPDHHVAKRFYDGCRIVEKVSVYGGDGAPAGETRTVSLPACCWAWSAGA